MARYIGALAAVLFGAWLIAGESPRANDLVSATGAATGDEADSPAAAAAIDEHRRGPRVPVSVAYHRGFNRIVFDWRRPVDYSVSRTGGQVVVRFDRAAQIDLATLTAQPRTYVYAAEAAIDGKATAVTLSIDPAGRLRHFRFGTQVTLDVFFTPASALAESESPSDAGVTSAGAPAPSASDDPIPVAEATVSPSPASNL